MSSLPALTSLTLAGCVAVTDEGVQAVSGLRTLTSLVILSTLLFTIANTSDQWCRTIAPRVRLGGSRHFRRDDNGFSALTAGGRGGRGVRGGMHGFGAR
jgi:hypothetical protein